MALQVTLSVEQYEALVVMAQRGAATSGDSAQLDAFMQLIERSNGFVRDLVWVQWQELDEPLPLGTRFPETWPPSLRAKVQFCTRKVTQADVEEAMRAAGARSPTSILVTRDPGATYGWTELSKFFA